jgi:hypothetical protein
MVVNKALFQYYLYIEKEREDCIDIGHIHSQTLRSINNIENLLKDNFSLVFNRSYIFRSKSSHLKISTKL